MAVGIVQCCHTIATLPKGRCGTCAGDDCLDDQGAKAVLIPASTWAEVTASLYPSKNCTP